MSSAIAIENFPAVEANISLFVPHVFTNFKADYIANAFKHIGEVDHIDLVAKVDRKGKYYNSVYIHFKHWHNTLCAQVFYEKVMSEKEQARLYHDDPWFWIVLPNSAKKHVSGERKPRIELEGAQSISCSTKLQKEEGEIDEDEQTEEEDDSVSIQAKMDETEQIMLEIEEEDDMHLISIDGRYVKAIEEENVRLMSFVKAYEFEKCSMLSEIEQLREALIRIDNMYKAEAAKVRAFGFGTD
jgi:predicted RNA-binding protein YlqC (UPF0109 family)